MTWSTDDRRFLEEAFELAERGRGSTSPNPLVGAVVVSDGRIVGRGYHACCGGPHAERIALDEAGARARGATLYVTLEPCSVHGRTPPCTDAIVAAGIARVVAPMGDPNPDVDGRGFETLRSSGIVVDEGLLPEKAARQNRPYLTYRREGRPCVRLKLACSLDGRIAGPHSGPREISCAASQEQVHALRAAVDGVLVGIGTVLADDPQLTDRRTAGGERQPRRFVLDTEARLPATSALAKTAREIETTVLCADDADPCRRAALEDLGLRTLEVKRGPKGLDLADALGRIASASTLDLLCEGGASVATSLLGGGLVDRLTLFLSPRIIGEAGTPAFGALPAGPLSDGRCLAERQWTPSGTDIRFDAAVLRAEAGDSLCEDGRREHAEEERTPCSQD